MPLNKDPWNDEPDRTIEVNRHEAHYIKMALEFAATHEDGWAGRPTYEQKMTDLAERADDVWRNGR